MASKIIDQIVYDRNVNAYSLQLWRQAGHLNWRITDLSSHVSPTSGTTQMVDVEINGARVASNTPGGSWALQVGDHVVVAEVGYFGDIVTPPVVDDPPVSQATTYNIYYGGPGDRATADLAEMWINRGGNLANKINTQATNGYYAAVGPGMVIGAQEANAVYRYGVDNFGIPAITMNGQETYKIHNNVTYIAGWSAADTYNVLAKVMGEQVIDDPTDPEPPLSPPRRFRATMTFGAMNQSFLGIVSAVAPVALGIQYRVDSVNIQGNNIVMEYSENKLTDREIVTMGGGQAAKYIIGALLVVGAVLIAYKVEEITANNVLQTILDDPNVSQTTKDQLIQDWNTRKQTGDPIQNTLGILTAALPILLVISVIGMLPRGR